MRFRRRYRRIGKVENLGSSAGEEALPPRPATSTENTIGMNALVVREGGAQELRSCWALKRLEKKPATREQTLSGLMENRVDHMGTRTRREGGGAMARDGRSSRAEVEGMRERAEREGRKGEGARLGSPNVGTVGRRAARANYRKKKRLRTDYPEASIV